MGKLAPEPIMRAALRTLHIAAYTTRNWTLNKEAPVKQINDLWEAIHEIPDLLTRWDSPSECEAEIRMYFREYDAKWDAPKLETVYDLRLSEKKQN